MNSNLHPIYLNPGYKAHYTLGANTGCGTIPHTKAPTGLSQPARRFPGRRTRRCPAPLFLGGVPLSPLCCLFSPVWPAPTPAQNLYILGDRIQNLRFPWKWKTQAWFADVAATKGRSYPLQIVLARNMTVIVPVSWYSIFKVQSQGDIPSCCYNNYFSMNF